MFYPPKTRTDKIVVVLAPMIVLFGLIGNILAAVILLRKRFRSRSITIYLLTLAVTDSIFLLSNTMLAWAVEIMTKVKLQSFTDIGCKFNKYFLLVSRAISAWVIVVLTVERFLATSIPHISMALNTRRRSACSTAVVTGIVLAVYGYTFYVYDDAYGVCYWTEEIILLNQHLLLNMFDFLFYSFTPATILATCNSMFIFMMFYSRILRKETANSCGLDTRSVFIIVITTSVAFIVLTMPMTIFQIVYTAGMKPKNKDLYPVLYALDLLNHAINFLLYCFSGPAFRKECRLLFRCRPKRRPRITIITDDVASLPRTSIPIAYRPFEFDV